MLELNLKSKIQNKKYDLEGRTLKFSEKVFEYLDNLPKSITHIEISKQLARAAGSVGANYIEANESLGKKDCIMRIKISRKEAKEARYWLNLTKPKNEQLQEKASLIKESTELMNIFGAILTKLS